MVGLDDQPIRKQFVIWFRFLVQIRYCGRNDLTLLARSSLNHYN